MEDFINQLTLDFEGLEDEHAIAASNEHVWALGSDTSEQATMHKENAELHRELAEFYRKLKQHPQQVLELLAKGGLA
jgi:DNA-directed RNA polymerase specialized sigma subunit